MGCGLNVPNRHHHVWGHYLSAWESNGKIFCRLRNGRSFTSAPSNLAVKKHFYKLPELSRKDVGFLRLYANSFELEHVRKFANDTVDMYARTSCLRHYCSEEIATDPALAKAIKDHDIQTEENFHQRIENDAVKYIANLRNKNVDFWSCEKAAAAFSLFISLQHTRTQKVQSKVVLGFEENENSDQLKRLWPAMRMIFTYNLGASIFVERERWQLKIFEATGDRNFITGDQPTQNLAAGIEHDDLAWFYPISPRYALLMSLKSYENPIFNSKYLEDDQVNQLNRGTYDYCHNQVFSRSSSDILEVIDE